VQLGQNASRAGLAPCYISVQRMAARRKTRLDNVTFRRACIACLVALCAFLVMHAIFGDNGLVVLRRRQREYRELQKQVETLGRENQQLELENTKLESDPKAIERLAREQLRLARPGEIIYTLPDAPQGTPADTATARKSSTR
jgi:cell division protein FtsB